MRTEKVEKLAVNLYDKKYVHTGLAILCMQVINCQCKEVFSQIVQAIYCPT